MPNIAIVGDKDSIYGFASIGLTIFPVDEAKEAAITIKRIADSGYAVIFITERLASQINQDLERYREMSIPAIIPIPGVSGNTGIGMKNVSKSVEKAVGSDILSNV